MKKFGLILAGAALVTAPVTAQSLRSAAPVAGDSELGGGGAGIYVAGFLAAVAAIVVIAVVNDDDDNPVSR